MPALDRTAPSGTFWITPPRYRNDLRKHDTFQHFINTARHALRATETAIQEDTNTTPSESP